MLEELSVPQGEWLLQTAAGSVLGRQVGRWGRSSADRWVIICPSAAKHLCRLPPKYELLDPTGGQVIALAKHRGIKTINVVRCSDAAKELKDLG